MHPDPDCHPAPVVALCILLLAAPAAAYAPQAVSSYETGAELVRVGDYTGAMKAFDAAIALEPSYFEAWNGKADAFNRQQKYPEALNASDTALAISPAYARGWINRGYILYNLGRYDEELAAYERAAAIDPGNADAWFNRGYALAGSGQYDEAIRSFDRVAEINPGYPNLEANRRIAEKNREAATPFVVRYAVWIIPALLIAAYIAVVLYTRIRNDR